MKPSNLQATRKPGPLRRRRAAAESKQAQPLARDQEAVIVAVVHAAHPGSPAEATEAADSLPVAVGKDPRPAERGVAGADDRPAPAPPDGRTAAPVELAP